MDGRGRAYNPSAGFRLPNGARRPPDASWIRKERVAALPKGTAKRLLSPMSRLRHRAPLSTDRIRRLKAKMEEYMANGAELGRLIGPEEREAWVYRPGRGAECVLNRSASTARG